jgi:hypothetical protein
MDSLHFCVIAVNLLLLLDKDVFIVEVVLVVGVVEFVHLMGSSMGIVPDELFGTIEVLVFWHLLLHWISGMGQHRLQIMLLNSTFIGMFHFRLAA